MKQLIGIITTVLIMAACAKSAPNLLEGAEDDTFRRWVAKNAPNAKLVEEDVYIEFFEHANINPDFKPNIDSSWVEVSYTGYTLDGTIFVTRYPDRYKLVGNSWLYTTHWSSEFFSLVPYYANQNAALLRGIREMREGDSARIYIPGKHGFGQNYPFNQGYIGETQTLYGKPVYFDVRLHKITNKPSDYEFKTLDSYAVNVWKQLTTDTLTKGIYYRKTIEVPEGDTIADDSYGKMHFAEYFLDGFIIKTSSDSIAKLNNIYSASTGGYYPKNVSLTGSFDGDNRLFARVLKELREGEEAEVICSSDWTEKGNMGSSDGKPQIDAFTPRLFKIMVLVDTTRKK